MKGLTDIQSEDNECFRWCLKPLNKNLAKIKNADSSFVNQYIFKFVKSCVPKTKQYIKIILFAIMVTD